MFQPQSEMLATSEGFVLRVPPVGGMDFVREALTILGSTIIAAGLLALSVVIYLAPIPSIKLSVYSLIGGIAFAVVASYSLRWFRAHVAFVLVTGEFRIIERALGIRREFVFQRSEIESVSLAETSVRSPFRKHHSLQLQLLTRDRRIVYLLAYRHDEELRWICQQLNRDLVISTATSEKVHGRY